jgi:acetoacetate decarboxylase
MPKIENMKGFAYPTPEGKASVVGGLPWHFGTEHLCVAYRTDPKALAAYLPEPLAPGGEPELVIVDFGKWYCLWDQLDMPANYPERTWYQETVIWIGCSFNGQQARFCVQSWVNKDFSLVRGMIMGFHKKFGETYKSIYHPLNPKMPAFGVGCRMKGRLTSHGEQLMAGGVDLEEEIAHDEVPELMRLGQINLRYFPGMDPGGKPSICDLMQLDATNLTYGKAYRGKAHLELFPSDLEEHTNLKIREILDGCYFENGCTITGGKVIYSWV